MSAQTGRVQGFKERIFAPSHAIFVNGLTKFDYLVNVLLGSCLSVHKPKFLPKGGLAQVAKPPSFCPNSSTWMAIIIWRQSTLSLFWPIRMKRVSSAGSCSWLTEGPNSIPFSMKVLLISVTLATRMPLFCRYPFVLRPLNHGHLIQQGSPVVEFL